MHPYTYPQNWCERLPPVGHLAAQEGSLAMTLERVGTGPGLSELAVQRLAGQIQTAIANLPAFCSALEGGDGDGGWGAVIATRGLRVVYAGGHVALDGVDLDIGAGVFGLLGPNGAGKTTLLRVLATLLVPTDGQVEVAGLLLPARAQEARFRLGYVPQEFGLFPKLRCRECLDYLGLLKGLAPSTVRLAEVDRVIEAVHLQEVAGRAVGALSGGMRRRLGIAAALLGSPEVLILDEPTASLDPEERTRLWNLLGGIAAQRTVLLSTHHVADVAALCPRLAVLDRGRVRFSGSPATLARLAEGRVWEIRVSRAEYEERRADWTIAATRAQEDSVVLRVHSDIAPHDTARSVEPTLEDGYLHLMGSHADA